MAIKDKDGSVYKLRGPNPIMKDQAEWDAAKVKLINCGWKSEVIEDQRNPIKEMKANTRDIGEELELEENPPTKVVAAKQFIGELQAPVVVKPKKPETPKPKPKPEPEPQAIEIEIEIVDPNEPVVLDVDPKTARILKERGTEFYCVPVVGKKSHTDNLYGDSYETPVYGEQYVFDAIIVDQSDLQIQFWCIRPITKGSVIHRKSAEKEGGERWWKVEDVESKSGGYLAIGNISELNPDFS